MFTRKMNSVLRRASVLILLQFVCFIGFSQLTLTGKITDKAGKALPGATIAVKGTYLGTVANSYGDYKFQNLKEGKYNFVVSFLGYQSTQKEIQVTKSTSLDFSLESSAIMADEVLVAATRAGNKAPVAVTNLSSDDVRKQNTGQDIPYQLNLTPSMVVSSEAGSGVGYSALRIRGTDASRINVTVNGVPLNDSESQGVFWVNMPDFSSSVDNIQIQRGVGTSTNGAAAFGATINFQTETINADPYAEVQSVAGSFNTFRNTIKVGTGLIDGKFSFDARYSRLKSDGFVDRAFSDHESFFVSGTYYKEKSMLKFNVMSGDQKTGISWWGNPTVNNPDESVVEDRKYNPAGEFTDENGVTRYYDNQTDNYKQTHYQLFYSQELTSNLNMNAALHYTKGKGFYEQYKEDESYAEYGLSNPIYGAEEVSSTDLTRQKWLKNDFYGFTYSLNYKKNSVDASFGGAWNRYDGDHFGNILWAQNGGVKNGYQWYFNNGEKTDYNTFAKISVELSDHLNVYGDVQYRHISYSMTGNDDDLKPLVQDHKFDFFNPKMGLYYTINDRNTAYASFGLAHREPTRANYKDAKEDITSFPKEESLFDYELGYNFKSAKATFGANVYYMYYRDQLVPTGEKNNVGSDIMTNVDKSYRAGIEFIWGVQLLSNLKWDANLTLSRNRIKDFTEYSTYYDENWNEEYKGKELGDTHISYSPEVIGSSVLNWTPSKGLGLSFISKYVGEQYFDNTSNTERKLDDYLVHNFRMDYAIQPTWMKEILFHVQINNVLDKKYENNAYGGNWYEQGDEKTWRYYYPQAGINFLAGVTLRF
ncbi:TonB-dependent receptor [Labilibaculum sp. DW002]|uniref:TonB-dependent receptor n=1 Tax=Paralabilibaculum antarcticum TaxID=2912572 RepID=A0ABT5VRA4_9BACT|nr:TonB-dependent receptor [Labilibaculum sp. DW002]MDE5417955.1 TonB-dependent receptor [Labilibaculum sp. DW002]